MPCTQLVHRSLLKIRRVAVISILNLGKESIKRFYIILAPQQEGETLREQGGIWVMPPSLPILAQLWVDSQVGNAAGDAWIRSKAGVLVELSFSFIYLLFPKRVSFLAACMARDCPLILCFIVRYELNTTWVQKPLRAQHPFCCSCLQPAEFTGVLLFMVYLLPEQGFLWFLFYLFFTVISWFVFFFFLFQFWGRV